MIIKSGHRIPMKLLQMVSDEEKGLLGIVAGQEARVDDSGEREKDETIERTMRKMDLPRGVLLDKPEEVLDIRKIVRDAAWKVWRKREKIIRKMKRERFLAVKRFLQKYPDLSVLVPWLLGETN